MTSPVQKLFLLPVLLLGLAGAAGAAEAPDSVAELFGPPENLRLVREAGLVEACILRHIPPAVRGDGSIDRSAERYEDTTFVPVPDATAAALRDLLLDGKTYDWKASSGGRRPQFYVRLRFHRGDDVLVIDFCFMCRALNLSRHGENIGHANFGPNADLLLQAFLKIFPRDEPLLGVAREMGLPPPADAALP